MKALILNGERENESALGPVQEILTRELSIPGWTAESILLREKEIARCMGCFGCWVKTPGVCVIDDFGREVARMVVGSDLLIFLTPITFGGYSSELKKAVDRFACPMLLPFFTKREGEVHHKARYKSLPDLIVIGIMPRKDGESERIFTKLVERNALNLQSQTTKSAIYYRSQDPERIGKGVRSLFGNVRK